jgi:hypothetical protein
MLWAGRVRLEKLPEHADGARDHASAVRSSAWQSAPRQRGNRGERILLVGMVIIAAIPVWRFGYFPTTDGGAHVAGADVLLQYFRPGGEGYRAYYQLNRLPVPNWAGHFVLALLMALLPALVAEKVFVTLYLLLLPLSVRYAACGVRRSGGWVALLAVPLSLNWMLHQGFFNFLISVAIYFYLLGYWLRRREVMTPARVVMLGVLGILLYAGHLLSIVVGCASILILGAWYTLAEARLRLRAAHGLRWEALWPGIRSRLVLSFAGLLPAAALALWFYRRSRDVHAGRGLAIFRADFWKDLLSLSNMISYRARAERPVAVLLAAVIAALVAGIVVRKFARREWRRRDGLLAVPAALTALYFTRGDRGSAQLFIPQRLVFYIYLTLLLFIAAQTYPAWVRRGVAVVALLVVVGLTAVRWPAYREYNAQMREFIALAERVEQGTTLLPLVYSPRGLPAVADTRGLRSTPFYTAAGYAVAARHAIDLRNYEAGLDYFPVRYRPELNPYEKLGVNTKDGKGLEMVPQRIDIEKYQRTSDGRVDYVLVWAVPDSLKEDPDTISAMRQLERGYTLVEQSASRRAQLWRRGH